MHSQDMMWLMHEQYFPSMSMCFRIQLMFFNVYIEYSLFHINKVGTLEVHQMSNSSNLIILWVPWDMNWTNYLHRLNGVKCRRKIINRTIGEPSFKVERTSSFNKAVWWSVQDDKHDIYHYFRLNVQLNDSKLFSPNFWHKWWIKNGAVFFNTFSPRLFF